MLALVESVPESPLHHFLYLAHSQDSLHMASLVRKRGFITFKKKIFLNYQRNTSNTLPTHSTFRKWRSSLENEGWPP